MRRIIAVFGAMAIMLGLISASAGTAQASSYTKYRHCHFQLYTYQPILPDGGLAVLVKPKGTRPSYCKNVTRVGFKPTKYYPLLTNDIKRSMYYIKVNKHGKGIWYGPGASFMWLSLTKKTAKTTFTFTGGPVYVGKHKTTGTVKGFSTHMSPQVEIWTVYYASSTSIYFGALYNCGTNNNKGATIYLQRYDSGKWHSIDSALSGSAPKGSDDDAALYDNKRTKGTKHKYRLYAPTRSTCFSGMSDVEKY